MATLAGKAAKKNLLCAAATLALALGGCSSKQQEEEVTATEDTTAESAPEETVEPAAESLAPETAESLSEGVAPAQPQNAEATTSSGASVKYVSAESCPVLDAPNGKEVGKLTRGEHILVWNEGEWSKTPEGHYVASKHLSAKGIGRERAPAVWGPGSGQ